MLFVIDLSAIHSSTCTGDRAYLFNSAFHDITIDYYLLGLSETEGSANCLLFGYRVPLRFENMYSRCTGEVQPEKGLEFPGLTTFKINLSMLTHPTAPVAIVMSNTICFETLSKPRRARCRSALDTEPSIRT
jgi:hypothetical protein